MWVEPDVDDLVAALREHVDPAKAADVERRRQNALTAAAVEGDVDAWVNRLNGMVSDLLKPQKLGSPKLGWVSTWEIQCGIAQYSGYLLDRMSVDQRKSTMILCDYRTKAPAKLADGSLAYTPVWQFIGDKGFLGSISVEWVPIRSWKPSRRLSCCTTHAICGAWVARKLQWSSRGCQR
jgi:hypothetical protein